MLRLLLAMSLASCGLHATSLTFASCTIGTDTQTSTGTDHASCSLSIPFLPPPSLATVNVSASAFTSDSVSGAQGTIAASTNAGAGYSVTPPPPGFQVAVTAKSSDSIDFGSAGPGRAGLIQFDIRFGILRTSTAEALLSDGVHYYSYANQSGSTPGNCAIGGCEYIATVPFDLGSPFHVFASGSADWAIINNKGAEGSSQIVFTLLEADGKTPVRFFVIPEPSTWGIELFGLGTYTWFLFRRRRAIRDGHALQFTGRVLRLLRF